MQNYQQMAASLNAQQREHLKEVNDLMNSTMSRCYAAYLAMGKNPPEAMQHAQAATHYFGVTLGIIKEVVKNDGEDNNGTILRG